MDSSAPEQIINKPPKITEIPFSKIALVLSNILPIVGILFFNWNTALILLIYFTETFIVGFFAAAKIALAQKDYYPISSASTVPIISEEADEAINYMPKMAAVFKFLGGHILITSIAILIGLFAFGQKVEDFVPQLYSLIVPAIGFTISFSISFKQNYLDKQEYLRTSARDIFRRHLTRFCLIFISPVLAVVLVEFLAQTLANHGFADLGASIRNNISYGKATGIILIGLVTLVDYCRHIFEHRDLAEVED